MNRALMTSMMSLVCLLGGCINDKTNLYEVALNGDVSVAEGFPNAGDVHLEFHVARINGEGALAYPLGAFDHRTISAFGPVQETLLYPTDEGTGLVVYGWLDADGDGLLCANGKPRVEPAGLVEVAGFPAHELSFTLLLDATCAGPESLYP